MRDPVAANPAYESPLPFYLSGFTCTRGYLFPFYGKNFPLILLYPSYFVLAIKLHFMKYEDILCIYHGAYIIYTHAGNAIV
jgi:hypothetical protein